MESLNPNVRGLSPSATLAINERSNQLISEGRTIVKLGLGQSPFPVPPTVVQSLRDNAHQKDYLPVQGLPELQEAVAQYHRTHHRMQCTADNVIIGPGSKELMFILQLVHQGELLIPSPSWVSYAPQAAILGRKTVWLDTLPSDAWKLTPDTLDAHCTGATGVPRLLILNYPNNPTGLTYNDAELGALASVARKHKILVLSDEIYGELHHQGSHRSLATHYPEGTIVSAGLSKWCGAGGWRLGTFVFPAQLQQTLKAVSAVASETFTSVSAPIQYAAITAFAGSPEIDDYLVRSRRIVRALGLWIASKLRQAGASVDDPHGGFYLFPDFSPLREKLAIRGVTTSPMLCKEALNHTGVAFLPGSAFGRNENELTARMAFVDFDGEQALRAADNDNLDDAFLNDYCSRVVNGINALCEWSVQ